MQCGMFDGSIHCEGNEVFIHFEGKLTVSSFSVRARVKKGRNWAKNECVSKQNKTGVKEVHVNET